MYRASRNLFEMPVSLSVAERSGSLKVAAAVESLRERRVALVAMLSDVGSLKFSPPSRRGFRARGFFTTVCTQKTHTSECKEHTWLSVRQC